MAVPLLERLAPGRLLIADKAYDADSLRRWLAARRIQAVIPSTRSRTVTYPLDRRAYARRNRIERLIGHRTNRRRVATRFDRLARIDLAGLAIAAVVTRWIE